MPFAAQALSVKTGQRSARRRSAVPNLKIFFPLNMARAQAEAISNRPPCHCRRTGFLLPAQSVFAWDRLDAFCKMHRRRGCSLLPPKEKKSAAVPAGHESPSGAFKPQTGLRSKCRVFSAARSQRFRRAGPTRKGLLAPFRPQRGSRTGKNLAASLNDFFSALHLQPLSRCGGSSPKGSGGGKTGHFAV